MKILIIILTVFIIFTSSINAQQEENVITTQSKHIVRMGGAGGFTPYLLFWDVPSINDAFFDKSFSSTIPKLRDTPLMLYGGQGYGYIMFIENFRIGGMGAKGSTSSSLIYNNVRRDIDASVSLGGVTLEYAIPLSERLDVVTGLMLGGGSLDIKLRRDNYKLKQWSDIINGWASNISADNYRSQVKGSFFVLVPSMNMEYAILRWISFRLGVSYLGMLSPNWELDEKFELVGVPSSLNGKGFVINAGIFLGTFLF